MCSFANCVRLDVRPYRKLRNKNARLDRYSARAAYMRPRGYTLQTHVAYAARPQNASIRLVCARVDAQPSTIIPRIRKPVRPGTYIYAYRNSVVRVRLRDSTAHHPHRFACVRIFAEGRQNYMRFRPRFGNDVYWTPFGL